MNANVISQSNWSAERIITHVLNWALIGVAYTIVVSTILDIVHTNLVNNRISNPLYEGMSFITSPLMIVLVIMLFFQLFGAKDTVKDSAYFLPKIFESRVWVYSVASVATAIVVGVISLVFEYENSTLGTPYGYVRVMDDGKVLQYGVTVPYDPTRVGSVPVSLNHKMNTSYVVKNGTGYAKYMTVAVKMSIDGNSEAFKAMLIQQDKNGLGWGSYHESRVSSQSMLFMKIMTPLLEPAVAQVFQEIAEGKLQGGNDIVMLRLGDVFSEMKENSSVTVPSWMKTINVSGVEVTGWQQS